MDAAFNQKAVVDYAEHLDRDGYAIISGVLEASEVERLRDAVEAIPAGEAYAAHNK